MNPIILLAIGSICFLIAAFLPVSRVYVEPSSEGKLKIINAHKTQWNIGHVLFVLGALLTAFALVFVVLSYKVEANRGLVYVGAGAIVIGAILWTWHCIERVSRPDRFAEGKHTPYLFLIYSILTQLALALFGYYLLQTEVTAWIAWMFVAGSTLIFIFLVVFRDMPPLVYYLLTIIAAFALM